MKRLWLGVAVLAAMGCDGGTTPPVDGGTGTDGGGTPHDGGGTMTDGGTTPALDCPTYCAAVSAACDVADPSLGGAPTNQYGTTLAGQCLGTCAAFPLGTAGDTAMNTIACRMYHAGAAAADKGNMSQDPHCWHAGPAGFYDGTGCGTSACQSFCMIVAHACTGAAGSATANPYADMGTCMTQCAAYAQLDDMSAGTGTPVDYNGTPVPTGDNLACRLYHATAAAAPNGAMDHCAHTGMTSSQCHP